MVQAKTKVANGRVFDMAITLSQGDLPDQIMQVCHMHTQPMTTDTGALLQS